MKWASYQLRYLADQAPQKCVVKSRRCGFSEVVSFERACRATGLQWTADRFVRIKPVNQNFVSAGLEQSKRLLAMAHNHLKALELVHRGKLIAKAGKTLIELTNGVQLRAFSSNPNTLRGVDGDVVLDEFAMIKGQEKLWAAAVAVAKATLGNRDGYQIVVVFTPLGDSNMAYQMAQGSMKESFSQHQVDIHMAMADGFPITIQDRQTGKRVPGTLRDLQEEVGDPSIFAQEFECSFLAASTRYIHEDIYNDASYHVEDLPAGFLDSGEMLTYGGLDLARVGDLTAWTRLGRVVDTNWHKSTDVARGMDFPSQHLWLAERMGGVMRGAVDASGMGIQFAEELLSRYPGVFEAVKFTNASKEILMSGLKLALMKKRLRPRADDIELKREVLSIRRELTEANNISYVTPRERGSHGDRAWSLALAEYASGGAAKATSLSPMAATPTESTRPELFQVPRRGGLWGR